MRTTVVSAPGKLMISGEYAVLEGAGAVVAAINRRVYAQFVSEGEPDRLSAEARHTRAVAEQATSRIPLNLSVEVSELTRGEKKLGMGSSAATAAATAAAVYAYHGYDLATQQVRNAVLDAASSGHRSVSPEGSGADVAASVLGGCIFFRREGKEVETRSLTWPGELHSRVVWTETEARTSEFVGHVRSFADRDPSGYRYLIDSLGKEAGRFVTAIRESRIDDILSAARRHAEVMDALGRAAGVAIVNDTIRDIGRLAERAGGTAKPSGAGGGDVVIAFFADLSAADRFVYACRARRLTVLPLKIGASGVRAEIQPRNRRWA